jgi:hypothetical protein
MELKEARQERIADFRFQIERLGLAPGKIYHTCTGTLENSSVF